MFYLQFGDDIDACFLFLAAEVQGAVKLVVHVGVGFVEHSSGGQPLFPAFSICLDGIADCCSAERNTGKNDRTSLGFKN